MIGQPRRGIRGTARGNGEPLDLRRLPLQSLSDSLSGRASFPSRFKPRERMGPTNKSLTSHYFLRLPVGRVYGPRSTIRTRDVSSASAVMLNQQVELWRLTIKVFAGLQLCVHVLWIKARAILIILAMISGLTIRCDNVTTCFARGSEFQQSGHCRDQNHVVLLQAQAYSYARGRELLAC